MMQTRPAITILAAVAIATVTLATAASVHAATCHDRTIQARGEASRFEVLAKAKARGNWRAQVRAMPALGPLYANWSRAEAADYACSEDKAGYVCTATARPCRE